MSTNHWIDLPIITSGGISTSVTVTNFPTSQNVNGTVTALQGTTPWTVSGNTSIVEGGNTLVVNSDGSINVANTANIISTSANLTQIPSSTSSQSVFSPSVSRKGFIMYNSSTSNCYVAFSSVSSNTAYTIELNPGMTYQNEAIIYTGNVSVIWTTANGFLAVTELV